MNPTLNESLARKRDSRNKLAALSFEEKLVLVQKMRERSLLLAQNPLRKRALPLAQGSEADPSKKS